MKKKKCFEKLHTSKHWSHGEDEEYEEKKLPKKTTTIMDIIE